MIDVSPDKSPPRNEPSQERAASEHCPLATKSVQEIDLRKR